MKNLIFKSILSTLFLLFWQFSFAQSTQTKTYSGEFENLEELRIEHRRGPIQVRASEDGKLRYEGKLKVTANEEEDAKTVISQFKFKEKKFGSTLELKSEFSVSIHVVNNNVTKIKFSDGTKVKNVGEISFEMVIYVPKLKKLHLANKYDAINIYDNYEGDLSVNLRSGKFRAQNVKGELEIESKYSKIYLETAQNMILDLYDCEMEMGNAAAVKLTSKYSELEFGDLKSLKATLHDDELEVGEIAGDFDLTDKYSEFEIGSFKNGIWDVHDIKFIGKNAENLEIKSKYSEFRFDNIDNLEFDSSHDDDLKIKTLGSFRAESKYSEFDIDHLKKSLRLFPSHDDKVEIDKLNTTFTEIELEGKYTDITIDVEDNLKYFLDVAMQYGKVSFDEDLFETKVWKEDHSNKEIRGKIKGTGEGAGKIIIKGHQNNVYLR